MAAMIVNYTVCSR